MPRVTDRFANTAEKLRHPDYTGANRCVRCTLANLVIAFGGTVMVASVSPSLSVLFFGFSLIAIYLRGYLIPLTPTLAERFLPEPDRRNRDRDSNWDPPPPIDDVRAVESFLVRQGALEEVGTVGDLRLSPLFDTPWRERMAKLPADADLTGTVTDDFNTHSNKHINAQSDVSNTHSDDVSNTHSDDVSNTHSDDVSNDTNDPILPIDAVFGDIAAEATTLRVAESGEDIVVIADGDSIARWESPAAMRADLAAAVEFSERGVEWDSMDPVVRLQILGALRLWLTRCPNCDDAVTVETADLDGTARAGPTVAATCESCGSTVFEANYGIEEF